MARRVRNVGESYALAQFAQALETAAHHSSAATREGAQKRLRQWRSVLEGMTSGKLRVGARAPVEGVPTWVTPEVVRGGFATGQAAAGGELSVGERALIDAAGLASTRDAVFAYGLTTNGASDLLKLAASGEFRATVPEETALMVVAWLVKHGDHEVASELVRELAPWRKALRFVPTPVADPPAPAGLMARETVADVRRRLDQVRVPASLQVARDVTVIWNPHRDEVLDLWVDGLASGVGDPAWMVRARALVDRHDDLVSRVPNRGRHARPGSNLEILVTATRWALDGQVERAVARARRPVADATARHGAAARAARTIHLAIAQRPTHQDFAQVVAARLQALPQDRGVAEPTAFTEPIGLNEATATLSEGQPIPPSVAALVERAREGSPEDLLSRGVIGSAEVLAELTPQVTADAVTAAYGDRELRAIMRANYLAFRGRRSLLLLDLEHQVRLEELPWVQAAAVHRTGAKTTPSAALALRRLTELTLSYFPATLVPNPMLTELGALAREAGTPLPLVEELAADIFMGRFSAKFVASAHRAAGLLSGSPYERYYDIDYAAVRDIPVLTGGANRNSSGVFDQLCFERAGRQPSRRNSVAAAGTIIEQSQILTTQNLATLIGEETGVDLDWAALAAAAADRAFALAGRLEHNPKPLRMVKDIAYAWRHTLFFLSLAPVERQVAAGDAIAEANAACAPQARDRMAPVVAGLLDIVAGARFDESGTSPSGGRRLLGWAADGPHWLLAE